MSSQKQLCYHLFSAQIIINIYSMKIGLKLSDNRVKVLVAIEGCKH